MNLMNNLVCHCWGSNEPIIIHMGIEYDDYGTFPILGNSFECVIFNDFEYCAKSEDTICHDHPYLKIGNTGGARTRILTILREDTQGNQFHPDWKQIMETWKNIRQKCKPEGGCF